MSAAALDSQQDFVPLGGDEEAEASFGQIKNDAPYDPTTFRAPREARQDQEHGSRTGRRHGGYDVRNDPRHAKDRPKSKHALPGYEPWVLVRTKFKRRFVHNTETEESLWFVPKEVMPGVIEFEKWEKSQKEKTENAKWAEEQLKQMRGRSEATGANGTEVADGRSRRRRSESLQREDEEAFMAELAAQAEHAEEQDAKATAQAVRSLQPQAVASHGQDLGLESDSEYEVVEVTDSEGEGDEQEAEVPVANSVNPESGDVQQPEAGPVEFGEDDIAYQLAAMGEDYGLDPGEYGDAGDEAWDEGAEGLPLSDEDAVNLFRDLLDDYHISPFTPWDKIIADESDASILNDDRYTVLANMRARKDVFDAWARDKAAQLNAERAAMERRDPRIPYLAFLHEKATPKLYWPEFRRKFKRESEMNDRKLGDKDREKLYRDHISRLKLPESSRKADLQNLLKGVPLKELNKDSNIDSLPQQVLSHLHYISLPSAVRDPLIRAHVKGLPAAPADNDMSYELRAEEDRRREERRRREHALAERERKVEEERRCAERDEARLRHR